jgi:hypothetical protein
MIDESVLTYQVEYGKKHARRASSVDNTMEIRSSFVRSGKDKQFECSSVGWRMRMMGF